MRVQAPERPEQTPAPAAEDTSANQNHAALGQRALVAVGWNGLQMWGYNFVALGVFVVLARLLEPRQFGLVADAMVIVTLMRVIVDAGFSRLLVQTRTLERIVSDTAFWAAALMGTVFAAATVAAAPLFARLFSQPQLVPLLRALSAIFIFAALDSVPTALLQRELNWRTQALRRLVATGASAAVAISLALGGAGAWALVGQQLTLEGLTVVLLWALVSWRPRLRFSAGAFKSLMSFGARYSALRILWFLGSNLDNFLIGVFLGPVALGFYVLAYRVFTVLNELLVTSINNVALSMFSRMQGEPRALRNSFVRTSIITFMVSLPVYAGLALTARQLVPALFGAHWTHSVSVLEFLTVAGCLQAQLAVMTSYVIGTDRVQREVPWALCVTSAQVAAFAATVHLGIAAVAAALGGVFLIAWPIRLLMLHRWDKLPLTDYLKRLAPIVAAGAAMAASVTATRLLLEHQSLAIGLTAEVVVGAVTYSGILSALAPAMARDVRLRLSQVLGSRRHTSESSETGQAQAAR